MDGGSTDGTLAILEKYRHRLNYVSEADRGAADAINRGFRRSSGSVLAWLNADDIYMPGAVTAAVRAFSSAPEAAVIYGEGVWIDELGATLARYPTVAPYRAGMFEVDCCICQPAAFFRRKAYEAAGNLDPGLHSAFDYDLWIRLSDRHPFAAVPELLAGSRMHKGNKTLGQRRLMFQEGMATLRQHYGYVPVNWIYGYLSYLKDGRDQFFEPMRYSIPVYLASLMAGAYYNPGSLGRYWRDWRSHINARTLRNALLRNDANGADKASGKR
jgi:glycosyltransferase involved in cell wall biosynthesis